MIDWPREGTGKSLLASLRGDAESGAGPGLFADLQVAFGGSGKQIQLEEQERERLRRHEVRTETSGPDDLDSGTIRITLRPQPEADG